MRVDIVVRPYIEHEIVDFWTQITDKDGVLAMIVSPAVELVTAYGRFAPPVPPLAQLRLKVLFVSGMFCPFN